MSISLKTNVLKCEERPGDQAFSSSSDTVSLRDLGQFTAPLGPSFHHLNPNCGYAPSSLKARSSDVSQGQKGKGPPNGVPGTRDGLFTGPCSGF